MVWSGHLMLFSLVELKTIFFFSAQRWPKVTVLHKIQVIRFSFWSFVSPYYCLRKKRTAFQARGRLNFFLYILCASIIAILNLPLLLYCSCNKCICLFKYITLVRSRKRCDFFLWLNWCYSRQRTYPNWIKSLYILYTRVNQWNGVKWH